MQVSAGARWFLLSPTQFVGERPGERGAGRSGGAMGRGGVRRLTKTAGWARFTVFAASRRAAPTQTRSTLKG
jgi:hypothetical protein